MSHKNYSTYRANSNPRRPESHQSHSERSSPPTTLKSSIRQVSSSSSFYNTLAPNSSTAPKQLFNKNKSQSTEIDSDMYQDEIVDLPDEEDEDMFNQPSNFYDDYQKRRRRSSDESSTSDHQSEPSVSKKNRTKDERNSPKRHKLSPEEREEGGQSIDSSDNSCNDSKSDLREYIESISDCSDENDQHQQKFDRTSNKTTPNEQNDNSTDNLNNETEEKNSNGTSQLEAVRPFRSRFDDEDDDDETHNEERCRQKYSHGRKQKKHVDDDDRTVQHIDDDQEDDEAREDRRHQHNHHKRSRRHSSSTPISSSSKSALTPPVSSHHFEKDLVEEKPKLPSYYPAIQGCRRVDEYKCLNRIEEGAYGVVFRAKDVKTGDIVALKRLKMEKEKEGFPITSLREICCILKSQHENVCTVREIVVGDDMNRIFIVMDYVEHDLKSLMTHTMKKPFSIGEVKTLMHQMLSGVNHLHDNWIIHRDLKTSNLLLNNRGILKIGDFGLAREYGSPIKPYTPIVVTLWYRAPELLLGIKEYSTPIDIWSVGAIFGELLLMKPLFPGKSELDQLNRIFKDLGTPNDKIWPDYSSLPFTKKMNFSPYTYNRLRNRFDTSLSEKGFDLLNKFLTYDPQKRISALDALKHTYFDESPRRIDPSMFPTWPSRNEEKEKPSAAIIQRSAGSSTATAQNEPRPPSGGKMYEKLLGGVEDEI